MSIEIVLDQQEYRPGSTVKGKLILEVKHPCSPKYIRLNARGTGRIRMQTHTKSEKYLDLTLYLRQHQHHGLSSGTHKFPFEFTLPLDSPSSFSGKLGRIQYTIAVCIPPANMLLIKGTKTSIDLPVVRDTPVLQPSLQPHYHNKRNAQGGWFQCSGTIMFTVDLPQTEFLQGEVVPISGQLESTSTSNIRLYVYLIQHVTYMFTEKKSINDTLQTVLVCTHRGKVRTIWNSNRKLHIPSKVVPTGSTHPCEFIDVCYSIKVAMLASGTAKSDYVMIPITVGNTYRESHSENEPVASSLFSTEPPHPSSGASGCGSV